MSAVDTIVTVVFCALGAALVWKWPVQCLIATIGLPVSAISWTVLGPEACWGFFGLTVAAIVAWSLCDGDNRVARPAVRSLLARPVACMWLVFLGSIAAAVLVPSDRLSAAALVVALISGGWLVWPLLRPVSPRPFTPQAVARRDRPASGRLGGLLGGLDGLDADRRPLESVQHLVATGYCPRCGSVMVASVRVPTSGPAPDTVVARAACPACGARAVGIVDPARHNRVVWLDLPPAGGDEPMEGVA